MNDFSWLEETPSKDATARVLQSADREIERYSRVAQNASRRSIFSIFSAEFLAAVPVAGIAAAFGFWLGSDDATNSNLQTSTDDGADLIDDAVRATDVELVADLDLLEELEILEAIKDEEMTS